MDAVITSKISMQTELHEMKPLTEKQLQRIANKTRKLSAFLNIAQLNDQDREEKVSKLRLKDGNSSESSREFEIDLETDRICKKKRIKTSHESNLNLLLNNEAEKEVKIGPSGKPLLTGEEYNLMKKRLRDQKKSLSQHPFFRLKTQGEDASVEKSENERTPLFLSDIQHLLLYSLIGTEAPNVPFSWCHFEKYNRVSHTVVVMVEGLSLYDYLAHQSCFPLLTKCFQTKVEVITPCSYHGNFVEELALVPLAHHKEKLLVQRHGTIERALQADGDVYRLFRAIFPILIPDDSTTSKLRPKYAITSVNHAAGSPGQAETYAGVAAALVSEEPQVKIAEPSATKPGKIAPEEFKNSSSDRFPRTKLIMSPSQLMDENFPLPLKGPLKTKYEGYIMTKDMYKEVTPESPMFAVDCEMCLTTVKLLELTRISIVNEDLDVIYDTLVRPYNPITNYLTKFSGITKRMMEGVTKRLENVQQDLRELLPMDAILVGQSLNSDLHTLRMMHPYVIDTSVIFNITNDYRRKTKLKTLSQRFLGETIQTAGAQGHCSAEDSSACMKLVQLKLANSIVFGDTILTSQTNFDPRMAASLGLPARNKKTYFNDDSGTDEDKDGDPTYNYYPVGPPAASKSPKRERAAKKPFIPLSVEYPCNSTSLDFPSPSVTPFKYEEHLGTTMFKCLTESKKNVGIVATESLIREYSRWIRKPGKMSNGPLIQNVQVEDNFGVFDHTAQLASKHAFTIGHARFNVKELELASDEQKREIFKEVDAACNDVWQAVKEDGICVVLFGGRTGGANGACFIQIRLADQRKSRSTTMMDFSHSRH